MKRRVFISSVIKGYEVYRNTAKIAVSDLHQEPVMAEDFPASSKSPQAACLEGVRSSDFYLGLFGERYSGPTADEYAEAKATGKEILVMTERVSRELQQADFLTAIESYVSGHLRDTFSDSAELHRKITRALASIITADKPDFKISNTAVLEFGRSLRKTSHESWLWGILAPAVQVEIISAARFTDSSFQEELLHLAIERKAPIFELRFASEVRLEKQALCCFQYDAYRHASTEVRRLELQRNGFVAYGCELSGSRDREEPFGGFYIDPDEVAIAVERFVSFAASLYSRLDSRRQISAFSLGFALVGTDKHFETPPRGKSSMSMPWAGRDFPDPILVPETPFTVKPEDLTQGRQYAEESVALFKQVFTARR
jgi:hypothetical protein